MPTDTNILIVRQPSKPGVLALYIGRYTEGSGYMEEANIHWIPKEFNTISEPTLVLNEKDPNVAGAMQSLANQLWGLGYRPSEAQMSDTAVKSKDAHLASLTKILEQVLPSALRERK